VRFLQLAQLSLADAIHRTARNHRRGANGHHNQAGIEGTRGCWLFTFSYAEVRKPQNNGTSTEKAPPEAAPNGESNPRSSETTVRLSEPLRLFGCACYLARPILRRRHLHTSIV
jgi:hypothetical protein